MQFTSKHLTRIRDIWEAFSQAYNSYSDEAPGSKVMGPDQFVVAACKLMEEVFQEGRLAGLKEMDEALCCVGYDQEKTDSLRKEYSQPK